MGVEPRPPPPVTIRDPARPTRQAEVLEAGPEGPAGPGTWSRSQTLVAVALLAAAALLVAGLQVRERRAATAAQERRVAGQVLLQAEASGSISRFDAPSDTGDLRLRVRLRNDGPREVTVLAGDLAGFPVQDELSLRPGAEGTVRLRGTVNCPTRLRDAREAGTLVLQVRTSAGLRRTDVALDPPFREDVLSEACGYGRVARQVTVDLVSATRQARALRLVLEVRSTSARPVQVQAVVLGPGLGATGLGTGPLGLPVPKDGSSGAVTLEVSASVTDCRAAARWTASRRPSATVALTDAQLVVFTASVDYEPSLVRELVRDVCPG